MKAAVLWACVCVAGCQHGAFGYRSSGIPPSGAGMSGVAAETGTYGARVSLSGGERLLAGVVVAVLLADGVRYYVRGEDGTMTPLQPASELDPGRKISEQDCTRPVDIERGNLKCRAHP